MDWARKAESGSDTEYVYVVKKNASIGCSQFDLGYESGNSVDVQSVQSTKKCKYCRRITWTCRLKNDYEETHRSFRICLKCLRTRDFSCNVCQERQTKELETAIKKLSNKN